MKSIFSSRARRYSQPAQEQTEQQEPFFSKTVQGDTMPSKTAFFQPKLSIGAPNDPYEKEADAVADRVVNHQGGAAPAVQAKEISSIQRLATPDEEKMPSTNDERMAEDKRIQEKPIEGTVQKAAMPELEKDKPVQKMEAPEEKDKPLQKAEDDELQAKAEGGSASPSSNFSTRLSARQGAGSPIPQAARSQMEQGIGADFSGVRIHTDSEAVDMSKDIQAQAFTHGNDIYFNAGKFNPEQTEGKRLLAHELTHVVQQSNSVQEPEHKVQRFSLANVGEFLGEAASGVMDTVSAIGGSLKQGAQDLYGRASGATQGARDRATEAGEVPRQRPERDNVSNFCSPYSSFVETTAAKIYLNSALLPATAGMFGGEVMGLWYQYLHDSSSARNTFKEGSTIANGFSSSAVLRTHVSQLMRLAASRYSLFMSITDNTWTDIPVSTIYSDTERKQGINFNNPFDIPGHIAGGTGSSDKGGPDTRELKGSVKAFREVDSSGNLVSLKLQSNFEVEVNDTVDFCPGDSGAGIEEVLTIPLSRLEASGEAWDVPFTVNFQPTPIDMLLDATALSGSPGATADQDHPEDRRSRGDRTREAGKVLDEKDRATQRINSR